MLPERPIHNCVNAVTAVKLITRFRVIRCRAKPDSSGTCYPSCRFARLCRRLGLRHMRTKPYTPRTNGKAERFIQTALREWAYAHSYESSDHRAQHLPLWLAEYNHRRPHASLNYRFR